MDLDSLAADVARAVNGTVVVLDRGDFPSRAVRVGDHCSILIRRHAVSFALSLPFEHQWSVLFTGDPSAAIAEIARATAAWTPIMTMSDVAASTDRFDVSWPGVPLPTEATLFRGGRHVGLFQEEGTVRVVVWVGSDMRSRRIAKRSDLEGLSAWIEHQLAEQEQVALAATKKLEEEAAARAAIPPPDFERVMHALRAGVEFQIGGGRTFSTYKMKNEQLVEAQFDEGHVDDYVIGETELRRAIAEHAPIFREVLDR